MRILPLALASLLLMTLPSCGAPPGKGAQDLPGQARLIHELFVGHYHPNWQGAYGLIGQSYLYRVTKDERYLDFATKRNSLCALEIGGWVDDTAWVCLAAMQWWDATGRKNADWVADVRKKYETRRAEGLIAHHEGYWTWYADKGRKDFSNENMNQMVTVACWLYDATREKRYLDDALLVWNGNAEAPGIEKRLYRGNGRWQGKPGVMEAGAELPFIGAGYLSVGAALYRATGDPKYKRIVVDTAHFILDPANGWVDGENYYQKTMDGSGAVVGFLMDGYGAAPEEMADVLEKCKTTLDHVWTNGHGRAKVVLHDPSTHAIRHGWNPEGGERGMAANEIGKTMSQGCALWAWGSVAYQESRRAK